MGNSDTTHSKKLRAETARKSAQKLVDQGGMRVSMLLEPKLAQQFSPLIELHGGQKKAFVVLLENYLSNSSTGGAELVKENAEEASSNVK